MQPNVATIFGVRTHGDEGTCVHAQAECDICTESGGFGTRDKFSFPAAQRLKIVPTVRNTIRAKKGQVVFLRCAKHGLNTEILLVKNYGVFSQKISFAEMFIISV